jgi:hypothetical protein
MSLLRDKNFGRYDDMNQPASLNFHMGSGVYGSYDNIYLQPGGASKWRKQPNNVPLKKNPIYVFQGTPLPLASEMKPTPIPKDSMFIFSRNVASPLCCPATYSTDRGCVCTTEQQRRYISMARGNNKNYPEDPDV